MKSLEKAKRLLEIALGYYSNSLSKEEIDLLILCVNLRNDLLHMSLSKATGKLNRFGAALLPGHVTMVSLETGEVTRVKETSTQKGKIYGWLLESATSRAFDQGAVVFSRGIEVLERLTDAAGTGAAAVAEEDH